MFYIPEHCIPAAQGGGLSRDTPKWLFCTPSLYGACHVLGRHFQQILPAGPSIQKASREQRQSVLQLRERGSVNSKNGFTSTKPAVK